MEIGTKVIKADRPDCGTGTVTNIHSDGNVDVEFPNAKFTWVEPVGFITEEQEQRNNLRNKVLSFIESAEIEAAEKLYESDCAEWWNKNEFWKLVEEKLLEEQRINLRGKVLGFLESGEVEIAEKLYETECADWWDKDEFLNEKKIAKERSLEEQRINLRGKVLGFLESGEIETAEKLDDACLVKEGLYCIVQTHLVAHLEQCELN